MTAMLTGYDFDASSETHIVIESLLFEYILLVTSIVNHSHNDEVLLCQTIVDVV